MSTLCGGHTTIGGHGPFGFDTLASALFDIIRTIVAERSDDAGGFKGGPWHFGDFGHNLFGDPDAEGAASGSPTIPAHSGGSTVLLGLGSVSLIAAGSHGASVFAEEAGFTVVASAGNETLRAAVLGQSSIAGGGEDGLLALNKPGPTMTASTGLDPYDPARSMAGYQITIQDWTSTTLPAPDHGPASPNPQGGFHATLPDGTTIALHTAASIHNH